MSTPTRLTHSGSRTASFKIEHSASCRLTKYDLATYLLMAADSRTSAARYAASTAASAFNPWCGSNMSDQASVPEHRNTRPFMSLGVVIYFGILVVLTFVALMPGAITIGTLLFISPGRILIASGTVLVYSIALLPAYFISRHLGERLLAGAAAVVGMAAAALLPHYIGGYLLGHLAASYTSDRPTSFQPRSFELPYQDENGQWTTWRGQALTAPRPLARISASNCCSRATSIRSLFSVDSSEDSVTHGTLVFTGGKAYLIPEGSKRTFRPIDLASTSQGRKFQLNGRKIRFRSGGGFGSNGKKRAPQP